MNLLELIPEIDVQGLLRKIPRPERSGVLSVILHYALLIGVLTAGAAADPDIRCWLHPDSCKGGETNESVMRQWNYVLVYPGGHGKKPCTCGHQMRNTKTGKFYDYKNDAVHEYLACDNDYSHTQALLLDFYSPEWHTGEMFVWGTDGRMTVATDWETRFVCDKEKP